MNQPAGGPAGKAAGGEVYRRLVRCVLPYWTMFLFAVVGLVTFGLTEPAIAALMKPMLDGSFVDRDPDIIRIIPLAIVGLALVRMVSGFVQRYAMEWVARRVIKDLRTRMFEQLLRLPARFYNRNAGGPLISKLTYDVEQVAGACSDAISVLIRDTVTLVCLFGLMFYLNWKLALMFVVVAPPIAASIAYLSRRFRRLGQKLQGSMGGLTQATDEVIQGHLVTKVFGGQQHEHAGFDRINERNRALRMKWVVADSLGSNVVLLLLTVVFAATIYAAATFAANDRTTVGGFVSFMAAMVMMQSPIKRLMKTNAVLQRGIAAAHSVFGLLDETPESDHGTGRLERAEGRVEYRSVEFCYDGRSDPAVAGVSLVAHPGETVALVGPSGGGKTSLVNLLPRFYDYQSGQILLDGTPITELRLESLRRQIALVTQHVILFNDTVANNIAYGRHGTVSREAVEAAAAAAQALDFIGALPDGFDTRIGDDGVLLSGGQRQRIAIARAVLKDAPILILDEATSALDTESEILVQRALENLMAKRTTLVIAHRLSTVENADRILVIEAGRIVESGTHDDLLRADGVYARLHRLQFGAMSVAV